ncbi:MAG TPA: hypothetical protein VEX38_00415 [Fimbriimonadaceae bacterium]|nr:hypothetical protein [Fimbriimonadaceae bacterium]
MPGLLLPILLLHLQSPEGALLGNLKASLDAGSRTGIQAAFAEKGGGEYLFEMARRRGGLKSLKVKVFPSPPGWPGEAKHWAVFHTFQDIEDDHDAVYEVVSGQGGLRLGKEIPEYATDFLRIRHAKLDVQIVPRSSSVFSTAHLDFNKPGAARAPIFRLNDPYELRSIIFDGRNSEVIAAREDSVPVIREGQTLRAGGLLIPWTTKPFSKAVVSSRGLINFKGEDHIDEKVAYVTSLWVPSLGRLPHTTATRIRGPKDWVLRSEGEPALASVAGFEDASAGQDEQIVVYKCDLPISYPKVVGGRYLLAAELKDGGRTYRAYHLDSVEKPRAERDVQLMAAAVSFFERTLGKFPFSGYECFDGEDYYGIESYSYTLLHKSITTRYVGHEIGHTYFGGIVPNTYVKDTWNEGVTTYVDDVLTGRMIDDPLQTGLDTWKLKLPLSQMTIAHENGSATYSRGAYVMKMLEVEIGLQATVEGLRRLVAGRVGKDTTWHDLRQYFEGTSGRDLVWFWNQWITNGDFPTFSIAGAQVSRTATGFSTKVKINQTGTPRPFRSRMAVRLGNGRQSTESVILLERNEQDFDVPSTFEPTEASLVLSPYTLGGSAPAYRLGTRPFGLAHLQSQKH